MLLSITELNNITGIDRRRIRKVLADQPQEKGPKGAICYQSIDVLPLLYLVDNDKHDLTEERARLAHHQANLAGFDEEVRKGALLEREDVVKEVTQVHANFRAKLLNIPPKMSTILIALSDVNDIETELNSVICEALEELHNQYAVHPRDDTSDQAAA
ncbi:hypothetical protein R0137_11070 [Congregibacter brevis]|uniref:Phage DNA packaging protein, Nu1 subunit of terminase n=1 Tax=Congregibacter brevis TaxID=3081201 RepID=A0ABZ0IAN8_9GAMM|nr:hypothetical protein R0137_11070 [Congregibacter sp. IMCC45268]